MISLGGTFKKRNNNNSNIPNITNITIEANITNKKTEHTKERVEEKTKCISTQGQFEMNN